MKLQQYKSQFELVVCGAGMSGIVAALQSARNGVKTALINDRGVLGGNASPEVRIHICGANGTSEFNMYADEGGILGELLTENRRKNPQGNVYLWHDVLLDKVLSQENLTVFLNTYIDTVNLNSTDDAIISVEGTQSGSEKRHIIEGGLFIDDTGDGTVGFLSGAEYMYGREERAKWDESIAPEVEDKGVLLSSMPFYSKDFHRDMPYNQPEYSKDIAQEFENALPTREIPDRIPLDARYDGYRFQWYYEVGAGLHQTLDNEKIRLEHLKLVSNIWEKIKNRSDFNAQNFDFEYISPVLGKRESRRLVGEYILKQQDVALQTDFDDCVGHGGWSIDLHSEGGFFSGDLINRHYYLRGVYQVPFRVSVIKNISNLMAASRCASFSHVALGTARVMGTLCMLGQACGVAASLCKKYNALPKDISDNHISELQQLLQQGDQFTFQAKKHHPAIKNSKITADTTFNGKLAHSGEFLPINTSMGLCLPVTPEVESINIYAKSCCDTELKYSIYIPSKRENYGAEVKISDNCIPLKSSEDMHEIVIPVNGVGEKSAKVFILFEENSEILLEMTKDKINGYDAFVQRKNIDDTFFDIVTLDTKTFLWKHLDILPVINTLVDVFSADNITNGYIRNYCHPNLWLSVDDTPQSLRIDLADKTFVNEVAITFDSLSENLKYDNLETYYTTNCCSSVVKDYDVYAVCNGVESKISSVRDNYQKVNRVSVGLECSAIRIELIKTNGSKRFAIYDIDFY